MHDVYAYVRMYVFTVCILSSLFISYLAFYVCMYVCMYVCVNSSLFLSSNGSSECSKSIFIGSEYLAAASDALLFLCESVFRLGEYATLTAIKHRLTDLFIRLCILVYSQVRFLQW